MIKARPLSCSVIDCFGLGAASLIALLNTDWTSAQNFQLLHANYTSRLHEANRCAHIMVKTIRVIITNLRVPNVWHSCISESYIRHALLIHKLCALSELWSLLYFCVKFQYICIVVQINVLWVFYNGCSPIEAQWCLSTYEHQTRPDNCSLIPSSSNHLQIDAFQQI